MKTWSSIAVALIVACGAPSIGRAATFIDFETNGDGTAAQADAPLYLQYGLQGLTFYPEPSGRQPHFVNQAGTQLMPSSGSLMAAGASNGVETFGQTTLAITFSSKQFVVQLNGGSASCVFGRLTAYDDAGIVMIGGQPLIDVQAMTPGHVSTRFSVNSGTPQITKVTFEALGFACDEVIDDLFFDGDPAPIPTGPPPTITISTPQPGTHEFAAEPFGVSGTVQGNNLAPQVTLALTALDTPNGPQDLPLPKQSWFANGGINVFGSDRVLPAALPYGHYHLVATVNDFFGRTAQATVDFSYVSALVTAQEALHPDLGAFQYAVQEPLCQLLVYANGGLGLPNSPGAIPPFLPPAVMTKWLATKSPMLRGTHTLGCPGGNDTTPSGWYMQIFQNGRIYVPPSGPTVYTTKDFVDAIEFLTDSNPSTLQHIADQFVAVGAPVADPDYDLDANDPTWMFQRFDQNNSGPAYQNTLEIRGRAPALYVERVGGDIHEMTGAGLTVDDRTPTHWAIAPCVANDNGMWPGSCDLPSLITKEPPGTTFTPPFQPQPVSEICGDHTWPIAPQWAPINGDNQSRITYQGLIKQHDNTSPAPGSHLAFEDQPTVHQYCNYTPLGVLDSASLVSIVPFECTVGFVGLIFGDNPCSDVTNQIEQTCRSDWNLHTRPMPGSRWVTNGAANAATHDFEIEWEAAFGRDYFQDFTPLSGDLVMARGRHIVDCAHDPFNNEIHPVDSLAVVNSTTTRRPGGGMLRATNGFIWANAFFTAGSVSYTIRPPPRQTPRSQLVVLTNEDGYFASRFVDVVTTPVSGGMQIDITTRVTADVNVDNDENQWIYPTLPDVLNFPYFQDHWLLFWQEPGEHIVWAGR
jgi:hypothetical protein